MLNRCEFIGHLGADPECKRLQSGNPVVNLRLAVSESWRDKNSGERKEKTEWISITIFSEGLCKVAESYLKKGSKIYIAGSWQTRKWQDQSGADRYSTECVLQGFDSKLVMLDGKPDDSGQSGGDYPERSSGQTNQQPSGGTSYNDERGGGSRELDDDIPF